MYLALIIAKANEVLINFSFLRDDLDFTKLQ